MVKDGDVAGVAEIFARETVSWEHVLLTATTDAGQASTATVRDDACHMGVCAKTHRQEGNALPKLLCRLGPHSRTHVDMQCGKRGVSWIYQDSVVSWVTWPLRFVSL